MIKMNTAPFLLAGLMLAASVGAAEESVPVPGSWIVELASPPTLEYRGGDSTLQALSGETGAKPLAATAPEATGARRFDARASAVRQYVDHLDRKRESLMSEASRMLGRPIEAERVYRHVMNGFSAKMSAEEAGRLARMPGVAAVHQNRAYRMHLDEGPDLIGAPEVWFGTGVEGTRGEGVVVGIIDSGVNWDHRYFSDDPTDTGGYDFENPLGSQLGECSKVSVPCNDKLIGVWNFADEGTDGKDPDGEGHGTHVASTAVGNPWNFSLQNVPGKTFRTSGVAPRANIISYKVCFFEHPTDDELDGRCVGDAITEALDQAVQDGVDVVNYSIGGDAIDPWQNPTAQKILNLRSAGITFVSSAGNSGPGLGTISSPANAPWAIAAGSSTHRRRIGNEARVAGVSDIFVQPGSGPTWSEDIGGPVITGEAGGGGILGCQAYPAGALQDAIAFVQRGSCTFETKVVNATDAGAAAVLVFNNVPGAPINMGGLEDTTIPSAMMDRTQGEAALASIGNFSNPTATLFAETAALLNEDWQDVVSDFSSRGPGADTPGVLKPNFTAPGQEIIGGFVPDESSIGILSGTSMASPHVAGAAALLKSRHPEWTPTIIQSALETTAETGPMTFNEGPATALDRGNGRIRVDRAAAVGLYLPVTTSDFQNANPNGGGDPSELNLAGMYSEDCGNGCQFTRTVRALQNGSWDVSVEGDLDVAVTPESFDLSEGQQRQLTITVDPGQMPLNALRESAVVLQPSGSLSTQRLLVAVSRDTELLVESNRGQTSMAAPAEAVMPEATFRTSALVRPTREEFQLSQDPVSTDPYSGSQGRRTFLVEVSAEALAIMAETVASSSDDIDLYIGRDDNQNGLAELDEEQCRSVSANELESCRILTPEAGPWWILVQNWLASSAGQDSVTLEYAVLDAADDSSLVASGPGVHQGGPLDIDLYWDQPAMLAGKTWVGAVGFSSTPDLLADLGVVPVFLKRTSDDLPKPTSLFHGETRAVVVPGNTSHEFLFVDVPPTATGLQIDVSGQSGIDGSLYRLNHSEIVGFAPGTPPAPTSGALETGTGSGTGFDLDHFAPPGATLSSGRYYIVLDNTAAQERRVNVSVSIEESAAASLPRFGLWSPMNRVIFQGFEWAAGAAGFVVWYSYDADGVPVFYNAVHSIDPERSTWSADLLRTTSIGVRNNVNTVGHLGITALGEDDMIVSWRLNGAHGSERLMPDSAPTCPSAGGEPVSYTGHWAAPGQAQGGTTMIITDTTQAQVRYYFDDLGVGRWVISNNRPGNGPLAEELDLLELRGFCPSCEQEEVTIETVGTYSRVFDGEGSAFEITDFDSRPPLDQSYSAEVQIEKLTSRRDCQ